MASDLEVRVAGLERSALKVDERMRRMGRDLEQAVELIRAATSSGAIAGVEDDGAAPTKMAGRYWHCAQCNVRLGFYRDDTEELRVKYKEFVVVIRPGPASVVRIPCVKCGHENTLEDSRKA